MEIPKSFSCFSKDYTENFRRAVRFESPTCIPVNFAINDSCWHHYPKEALWDLMEAHKYLFPDFVRPPKDWMPEYSPVAQKDAPYTDPMGCTWVTSDNGITGTVKDHPLADWSAFGTSWRMPDPNETDGLTPVNWSEREAQWEEAKRSGNGLHLSLRHGHTFLQLCDLRGYENLIFDMVDEEPMLQKLIEQLQDFNINLIKRFVKCGCDSIGYPEDLGMQVGPMLSPDFFRQYIKPSYAALMSPAREAGIPIRMHSDGDIRSLADDLIESGVEVVNLQDLVNGVDWIAERFRGKTCVELDIDRQSITPRGTAKEIDAFIKEEIEKIAVKEGGLCLVYGLYPEVPLENVAALMDALEKHAANL